MQISKNLILRTVTAFVLGLGFWLLLIYLPATYFSYVLIAILAQIIFFEWKNFFHLRSALFWLTLPLYPVLPFYLLIRLNNDPMYHNLLIYLFILVSSHDTGSYIVGNLIGKHKISPTISPKKTWEGFLGGWVFATVGLYLVLWEQELSLSIPFITSFALLICTLAFWGDLFESWLKRRAHIKDSGSILPGHGGFLDRFDGILFAVFFFYAFRDQLRMIFLLADK